MSRPSRVIPALLTSSSTGPCCSSTSAKARSTAVESVTSHSTPNSPSGEPLPRCVTATESPFASNERAIASPIPRLPPVTSTDLPTCLSPAPGCLPAGNLAGGRRSHPPEAVAWDGEATAGTLCLSAAAAAMFALDEVVVHGWEPARATGQPYETDDATVHALVAFLRDQPRHEELVGPVMQPPAGAPAI